MSNEKLFEIAVRSKLRFPFKGMVSAEDLWDLSTTDLDSVFKQLNSKVKQTKEESLLNKKTAEDEALDTQIEIVKYIVGVKLAEDEARKEAKSKREMRQKLLSIKAEKQDADLKGKSIAEIDAMLGELEG